MENLRNIKVEEEHVIIKNYIAQLYRDKEGRWLWSLEHIINGNRLISGIGYTAKRNCVKILNDVINLSFFKNEKKIEAEKGQYLYNFYDKDGYVLAFTDEHYTKKQCEQFLIKLIEDFTEKEITLPLPSIEEIEEIQEKEEELV